jgi:hypothetical protein
MPSGLNVIPAIHINDCMTDSQEYRSIIENVWRSLSMCSKWCRRIGISLLTSRLPQPGPGRPKNPARKQGGKQKETNIIKTNSR